MVAGWREEALAEIGSIKRRWADKHGWAPEVDAGGGDGNCIDLYVRFRRREPGEAADAPPRIYLLRLRYQEDFRTAGRREQFVDPGDRNREGTPYWPAGANGFQPSRTPPAICLEGTYGFHSDLHRERDGRKANLNRLLVEIQKCLS
jgi:hypothetical protein